MCTLKSNARGILLGTCPKVEYSGHTRRMPTLARLKLNKNLPSIQLGCELLGDCAVTLAAKCPVTVS